jgi:coenzyme F420-reducing hydrogenase beta subunit
MKVISDTADNMTDARAFSGSKYVKSDFRGMFPKVKELLKNDNYVLYTGLPCECAGLRSYLRKDYDNLMICELVCHASPSPKVFQQYIDYVNEKYGSKVKNIVFRDKRKGWKIGEATMVITMEDGKTYTHRSVEDPFFKAFLSEFIIRPSCNNCEYVFKKRAGDITLGDCWGIEKVAPEFFDDKGVSMILVNNSKGEVAWNLLKDQFRMKECDVKDAFSKNHVKPSKDTRKRTAFFNELDQESIEKLLVKYNKL